MAALNRCITPETLPPSNSTTHLRREHGIRVSLRDIMWQFLLLSAIGSMFGDLLLFRVGDFAITFPHFLLLCTVIINIVLVPKAVNRNVTILCISMIVIQVYYAYFLFFLVEREWWNSFIQFIVYTSCLVLLTSARIDGELLPKITLWTMKLGIWLGSLSLIQFVLLQFGLPAYLPDFLRVGSIDPLGDITARYGGFAPAFGLATEPSLHAMGLATLLGCLLFFGGVMTISNRFMWIISVIVLVGGIVVSFSLTGIIMAGVLLAISVVFQRKVRYLAMVLILAVVLLGIMQGNIIEPILSRLQTVSDGEDSSAQVRVQYSIQLLFSQSSSIDLSLLGTGLGMESRELDLYQDVYYQERNLDSGSSDRVTTHNIFATVKLLQGWIGLALYLWLLWEILRPNKDEPRRFIPLLVLTLLFNFASGYYLTPYFWSFNALVFLLRRLPVTKMIG